MSTTPLIIDANTQALNNRIHQIKDFLDAIEGGCQAIEEQYINIPIHNTYHPSYFDYINYVKVIKIIYSDIQGYYQCKEKGLI